LPKFVRWYREYYSQGKRGVLNTSLKSACLLRDCAPLLLVAVARAQHPGQIQIISDIIAMMVFSSFLLASTVLGQDTGAIKGTVERHYP